VKPVQNSSTTSSPPHRIVDHRCHPPIPRKSSNTKLLTVTVPRPDKLRPSALSSALKPGEKGCSRVGDSVGRGREVGGRRRIDFGGGDGLRVSSGSATPNISLVAPELLGMAD